MFPSVYAVAGARETELGRMMGAALYFKGDALVAGRSAAQLWGLLDVTQRAAGETPIDMLLPGRNAEPAPGISVHRVKAVVREDMRWRSGMPVTSPARTILDLAGAVNSLDLEAALSAALRGNRVRLSQLDEVISRNPRAKGIGSLRKLLDRPETLRDTRSRYERKLLALLKAAELPLPLTNVTVAGKMVDGLWPELKLVYEFDGWIYHRGKFEDDRERDQLLLAAGYRLIRISARQIDLKPYALIARISSIVATSRLRSST